MTSHALQANRIVLHLVLALGGSLLILGGMYYAASHAGHDIDPAQLIDAIKTSSPELFLAYVVISLLGIVFRAWRYRVLLQASGESSIPGFRDMTLITAVRNMTVDLLPARLGELVFVVLLKSRAGTQVSAGLSALLFSTLLDIVILAPITIAIGLMVGFPSKQPYLLALIALVA
ncbi:MAG TPA: lysylphosphatidylglycerol synthase domain-containing protein, partial [Arenicellales bacterium]|nr:lysylphosphatidylglycerol synthase domain-containing protein [Arenicellales bacterium]